MTLVDTLVPDELWQLVEPLLPTPPRPWYGGRRRIVPDRNCFAAIVYMTRTSVPWRLLPAGELGCGSPANGLAPAGRVGQGRRVRRPPRRSAGPVGVGGPAGLVAGERGHDQRAGQAGGIWLAQIQSTAASQAPSFTWSLMATASRWRSW